MTYNLDWLIEKYNTPEKISYLFFWGHQPNADGSIGKTCFSQWWQADFTVDAITYPTAEHYMMAAKARLFEDEKALKKILLAKTPAEAKKLGRTVENFETAVWDVHKYEAVKKGNLHKFSQHEALKAFLLTTGDKIIVEASPVDAIWGIGMEQADTNIENPTQWKGLNLLGFALMEVRDEINGG